MNENDWGNEDKSNNTLLAADYFAVGKTDFSNE